ncbi:MAG: hypothetical protein HRU32_03985 [Rhodobacteraceae bacterium]|nr:hypothetical protein [Paracoccaceae bacterium]
MRRVLAIGLAVALGACSPQVEPRVSMQNDFREAAVDDTIQEEALTANGGSLSSNGATVVAVIGLVALIALADQVGGAVGTLPSN